MNKRTGPMFMKRLLSILLIAMVMLALAIGCAVPGDEAPVKTSHHPQPQPENTGGAAELIESYLVTLTSAEFAGRMAGTPGNALAASWLADRLIEFGIEAYDGVSHKVGYTGGSYTFQRSEIVIRHGDDVDTLVQGVDFFISLSQGSFSISVDRDSGGYAFKGDEEVRGQGTTGGFELFVNFESRRRFSNAAYRPGADRLSGDIVVQLSDDVYGRLHNGLFDRIEINNVVVYEEMRLDHVAGRIRGRDSSIGVVLSAHFDHLGEGGSAFFPGALDNASGTAALLHIARKLKTISEGQPFDFDVIIAFFNSEEHGDADMRPVGSQHFIPMLTDNYETIFNINIDGVGLGDDEAYIAGDVGDSGLISAFEAFADGRGIALDASTSIMSDHLNFRAAGLPAINFTSSYYPVTGVEVAHTNEDTYERLSIHQIIRLADMIADFTAEKGGSVFIKADSVPLAIQFAEVFNRLRDGEDIRFHDDFYMRLPEEKQFYYTYNEALEDEERLAYISVFGDYSLRVIGGGPNYSGRRSFYYFNSEDPGSFDLTISPTDPERIEMYREAHDISEAADMPGYFLLRPLYMGNVIPMITGFVFTDGQHYFDVSMVYTGVGIEQSDETLFRSEPEGYAIFFVSQLEGIPTRNEEEYIKLIRGLRLDEFTEAWSMFVD